MMGTLEERAVAAWKKWGNGDARYGRCDGCGDFVPVRKKWKGRRWLCLACFDGGAR